MDRPYHFWTPLMTQKLKDLYTRGVDTDKIATQLRVKPSQVRNKALYMGYARPGHYKKKRTTMWKKPGMIERLTQLYSIDGAHVDDIAEEFGVSPEKVWGKITHLSLHRPANYDRRHKRDRQSQGIDGKFIHDTKPKPHINIPTEWNGNGTIRINLYNLIEAWNKDLDYSYHNLPVGLTVDSLDMKIRNGEWSLL